MVNLLAIQKTQAEGAAEKVASKAKEVAEEAKEAVEGAVIWRKNIFKKTENNSFFVLIT